MAKAERFDYAASAERFSQENPQFANSIAGDPQWSWWLSEPETQVGTPPLFIDGSPHERGNPDCCGYFGGPCDACGVGLVHYQPCYGGFIEVCDYCGDDSSA